MEANKFSFKFVRTPTSHDEMFKFNTGNFHNLFASSIILFSDTIDNVKAKIQGSDTFFSSGGSETRLFDF